MLFRIVARSNLRATTPRSALSFNSTLRYKSSYTQIPKVKELSDLNKRLAATDKLTLVDCYATWCGPCKSMAPHLSKLMEEYPDVNFLRVDIDEGQEIAKHLEVTAVPTFVLSKKGTILNRVIGADPHNLEKAIKATL